MPSALDRATDAILDRLYPEAQFAIVVQEFCVECKYGLVALSRRAGYSPMRVPNAVKGYTKLSLAMMQRVADAMLAVAGEVGP